MQMHQLNITESIKWLNKNTQETWSRSKFYRLRQFDFFKGSWRADKNADHFTITALKRGCQRIGVPLKK